MPHFLSGNAINDMNGTNDMNDMNDKHASRRERVRCWECDSRAGTRKDIPTNS